MSFSSVCGWTPLVEIRFLCVAEAAALEATVDTGTPWSIFTVQLYTMSVCFLCVAETAALQAAVATGPHLVELRFLCVAEAAALEAAVAAEPPSGAPHV